MILTVVIGVISPSSVKEMPTNPNKTMGEALSVAKESSILVPILVLLTTFRLFVAFTNLTPLFNRDAGHSQVTAGLYAALFAGGLHHYSSGRWFHGRQDEADDAFAMGLCGHYCLCP